MPWGPFISASVANPPSPVYPGTPFPAIVVMTPETSIFLTRLLLYSVKYTFPNLSTAMSLAQLTFAIVAIPPSPLHPPMPVPAIVEII